MALALFDLDDTLLPFDSDYMWSTFMVEKGYIKDPDFAIKKNTFKEQYHQGALDIYEYLAFMATTLNGLGEKRYQYHHEFIEERIRPRIPQQSIDLIRSHQKKNHHTIIVTATIEFIVEPISHLFQVDNLIASQLEEFKERISQPNHESKNLIYTGRVHGIPSYQKGKVMRIEEFLQDNPQFNLQGSFFYSDSFNDIPLLEMVDHPVVVNPDNRLFHHAQKKNWSILPLFDQSD